MRRKNKLFHPDVYISPPHNSIDHLLQRDLIRSSTFRITGFGAEEHTIKHDSEYRPRDRGQYSERAKKSYVIARLLFEKRPVIQDSALFQSVGYLWNYLRNTNLMFGPDTLFPPELLLYNSHLLGQTIPILDKHWCSAHIALSHGQLEKYQIIMWLSTLAYSKEANMRLVHTATAFYCIPVLRQVDPPHYTTFQVSSGDKFGDIKSDLQNSMRSFEGSPEASLPKENGETKQQALQRKQGVYRSKIATVTQTFIEALKQQWPVPTPTAPTGNSFNTYINLNDAMAKIQRKWKVWYQNHYLHKYMDQVEAVLCEQIANPVTVLPYNWDRGRYNEKLQRCHVSMNDVFAMPCPLLPPTMPMDLTTLTIFKPQSEDSTTQLQSFVDTLNGQVSGMYEKRYIHDLKDSLVYLNRDSRKHVLTYSGNDMTTMLQSHHKACNQYVQDLFDSMQSAFATKYEIASVVQYGPRISPLFYLQQLSHNRWHLVPDAWKPFIIQYALALTMQQRSERLLSVNNDIDLIAELNNSGHKNWDPMQYHEWLLLEVESRIMIRPVQADIAGQMLDPDDASNSVMQLNMGEGKSTVIVPVVCAALAKKKILVRVIVARPQSKQMLQMMTSKLGGLLNRRIFHLPFSRSLKLSVADAETIRAMCIECRELGGILLVQPEHILSFKLMGIECSIKGSEDLARSFLSTQAFFDVESRDIIDESDENFSVKFELIYTMGMSQPIELSPDRWIITHHILHYVSRFGQEVSDEIGSRVIEMDNRWPGRFPRIRILRPEGHDALLTKLGSHICQNGMPSFPIAHLSRNLRSAVFKYITQSDPPVEDMESIDLAIKSGNLSESMQGALLLARGLIAGGVLSFTLGKTRWRVNYGLDSSRTPPTKLAVPYRAKDSPTLRSEFSHPDVVIVLTTLSYYYGGLNDEDLFVCFNHLLESDKASVEYGLLVKTAPELPQAFHQLSGISFKDHFQCINDVFPPLRYSKGAIDYFLAHLVFPKMMKEFPNKISASGWDLGQKKAKITTGFSGTNDSRHLLPLDVKHLDLASQKHTNSLVLKYILQNENSTMLLPPRDATEDAQVSDARLLLKSVFGLEPVVRVILDVGAQILEMNNQEVAVEWLKMWRNDEHTKAVIFFNDSDELTVIDRKGQVELLQISPFVNQMDACLVFLDESHTRGTDLKLPTNYRAAVTLGANLTKDRLVQGKYSIADESHC
jgi:Protein of unknown function (DUF3638)/Protein of unknown function (DUF3645)